MGPFSVLVSMDGNNLLKRIHSAARGHNKLPDSRQIVSDRWLSAAQVNEFSNEVGKSTAVCTLSFTLLVRHPTLAAWQRRHRGTRGACEKLGGEDKFQMQWQMAECRPRVPQTNVFLIWWNRSIHCLLPSPHSTVCVRHDSKWRTVSTPSWIYHNGTLTLVFECKISSRDRKQTFRWRWWKNWLRIRHWMRIQQDAFKQQPWS